jgi:hypothetical protein
MVKLGRAGEIDVQDNEMTRGLQDFAARSDRLDYSISAFFWADIVNVYECE